MARSTPEPAMLPIVGESVTGRPRIVPTHTPSGRRPIFTVGPLTSQSSKVARLEGWACVRSAQRTSPEDPGFWPGLPGGTEDMGIGTVGWDAESSVAQPARARRDATARIRREFT
jgi:hypothetical protein